MNCLGFSKRCLKAKISLSMNLVVFHQIAWLHNHSSVHFWILCFSGCFQSTFSPALSLTLTLFCVTLISYQVVQIYNTHGSGKWLGLFIVVVCSFSTDGALTSFSSSLVSNRKALKRYLTWPLNVNVTEIMLQGRASVNVIVSLSIFCSQVTSVISQTGPHLVNWPKRYDKCVCYFSQTYRWE